MASAAVDTGVPKAKVRDDRTRRPNATTTTERDDDDDDDG
jgi:hypothetical protein